MSASARHRRTKPQGNLGSPPGRISPNVGSSDHDHANHPNNNNDDNDNDGYAKKDHHHHHQHNMHCRRNHSHHHSHQTLWEEWLSMMMLMIPRRIRRYYYYHGYTPVDLCAIGLVFILVTFLLVQYIGVMSFLETTFPDTSQQFQWDREFFDHPHALPILVVGGTDGSGTRAFVHTLKRLGVLIVADDPHTFDVHAAIMFRKLGWPKLITTVLEATNGSLHYDWETLPTTTQMILEREVKKLCLSLAAKYAENKRRMRLAESIRLRPRPGRTNPQITSMMMAPTTEQQQATGVAFAFKAPVAMLVLPLLTKFMGPVKFLHVVRDGRDIALSSNQSPVLKFYNATYPDYLQRTRQFQGDLYPVRGIQLWNDWNVQVYQWSQQKIMQSYNTTSTITATINNNQDNPVTPQSRDDKAAGAVQQQQEQGTRPVFDYLLMRSEDLIDPSTRYDCFQRLALFVQSPLTPQELCCLSQLQPEDFGQSTVHSESTNNFAAHPEEWVNMGRKPNYGRSKLFSLLDGSEEDPRNHGHRHNQDAKERRKQERMRMYEDPDVDGDGDMTTTTTDKSIDQDKYQQEMEALRAELALKDRTIRVLESKLNRLLGRPDDKEKEQELGPEHSLQQPQDDPPQQHDKGIADEEDESPQEQEKELDQANVQQGDNEQPTPQEKEQQQRRQLSENDEPPKVVPTMFLKHFSTWQEHVMTSGQELPLPTLQKLLDFGASLQKQYEMNASALQSVLSLEEIKETCHYLQTLIRDRRKSHHDTLVKPHHHHHGREEDEEALAIHERYGKWKVKLEKQPVLSEWLHREGKVGLQLFGYEPRQDWTYTVMNSSNNDTTATTTTTTSEAFTCNKQVVCSRPDPAMDLHRPVTLKAFHN